VFGGEVLAQSGVEAVDLGDHCLQRLLEDVGVEAVAVQQLTLEGRLISRGTASPGGTLEAHRPTIAVPV
jgi:hypothetical protein